MLILQIPTAAIGRVSGSPSLAHGLIVIVYDVVLDDLHWLRTGFKKNSSYTPNDRILHLKFTISEKLNV